MVRDVTKMFFLFFFFFLLSCEVFPINAIDVLPCTEGPNAADIALAQRLLTESTPPGYRLIQIDWLVQTGRNPHRWIGHFERIDQVYNNDCDYLTSVRTAFNRICPAGSTISQVGVVNNINRRCISVQYLVNCGCRKIPRRRKRYATEGSTCTGIPHFKP